MTQTLVLHENDSGRSLVRQGGKVAQKGNQLSWQRQAGVASVKRGVGTELSRIDNWCKFPGIR